MSYYRIVDPVLIVGFLVSCFSVVWVEKVVPAAKTEANRILNEEIRGNLTPSSQKHVVIKSLSDNVQRITYAKSFNQNTGRMEELTIEELEDSKLARIQVAEYAIWDGGKWHMYNGYVYEVDSSNGVTNKAFFKEQILPLDYTPKQVSWEQKNIEEMTISELRGYIEILKAKGEPYSQPATEM